MNQKRKRLGLWILFLAALLLTQFTVPVKASEPQIQDVNIQMVGGQIRTIDPMGLRMVACIKKSYIQELEKSGATVSYGIVLLPKKYLTEGQALTLDGKYLYNGSVYKPAKVPAVKKFSEDNDRIYFTAVLANLPKERYKNDYAARAYAEITRTVTEDDGKKKTTTEVVYSESEIDRQVYRIAEEAVNGTTETEETKQWLQDNILAPVDKPEELPEEEFYAIEDNYILHLDRIFQNNIRLSQKHIKIAAILLIVFGVAVFWNGFRDLLFWILPNSLAIIIQDIMYQIPSVIIGILIIVAGYQLLTGKIKSISPDEKADCKKDVSEHYWQPYRPYQQPVDNSAPQMNTKSAPASTVSSTTQPDQNADNVIKNTDIKISDTTSVQPFITAEPDNNSAK